MFFFAILRHSKCRSLGPTSLDSNTFKTFVFWFLKNWCAYILSWYGKTRVTSCELRVTSWKLKSTSWKLKSTSGNSKVRVQIHELRVQIHEFWWHSLVLRFHYFMLRLQQQVEWVDINFERRDLNSPQKCHPPPDNSPLCF